ncbi:ATP-binding protein [Streptomyces sp. NPDC048224]|uniref:ATP-binding protein n=1 Tax=Streptomyces sp. NPDC048224 TaxID=3154500 RepID=UPI0033D36C0E
MLVGDRAEHGGCTGHPDDYVLRSGRTLNADGGRIADARHHTAAFLDQAAQEHGLPVPAQTRDLTLLVVSELVTNARKYAPGPVRIELRISARTVEVAVSDTHTAVPAARPADPRRIGQHGLEIVKAVTEEFTVEQEPGGKRITARIPLIQEQRAGDAGTAPS